MKKTLKEIQKDLNKIIDAAIKMAKKDGIIGEVNFEVMAKKNLIVGEVNFKMEKRTPLKEKQTNEAPI